ncbi:MAG: type II secretion system protein [Planctomycetota bacterium]|jgi:hypothetical protein
MIPYLGDKENKVKAIGKQYGRQAAFTIIELLTVMSVIIILIGILVPGLTALKRYAWDVTQREQFHAMDTALEGFNAERGAYPDSGAAGVVGALELAISMVGVDLLGYSLNGIYDPCDLSNRRKYMELRDAKPYRLQDLYPAYAPFSGAEYVLCDVYRKVEHALSGNLVGMPVLYYSANTARFGQNIYNFTDNEPLIILGKPWEIGQPVHRLDEVMFDIGIRNDEIWENSNKTLYRPHRDNSYILLSAGYDGEYGTGDDISNFVGHVDWEKQ